MSFSDAVLFVGHGRGAELAGPHGAARLICWLPGVAGRAGFADGVWFHGLGPKGGTVSKRRGLNAYMASAPEAALRRLVLLHSRRSFSPQSKEGAFMCHLGDSEA